MTFKSIDLQVSLPRTAEISTLAQQQQHRSVNEQALLAQQNLKTAEQQATRMTRTEAAAKGEISERQPGGGGRQQGKGKKQTGGTEHEQDKRSEHPFKGKHIDFMG